MRARYIGKKILTGYYGMTLSPGQVFTVPEAHVHRVSNTPTLFEKVEEDQKPRRGRPRKKVAQ